MQLSTQNTGRTPFWASPRHLRRRIMRGFMVAQRPLDSRELAEYVYRPPWRRWHTWNVRRAMRDWGIEPLSRTGRRGALLWWWTAPE